MTLEEAITAARAETDHDNDTQVTDPQITEHINTRYQNLRRELAQVAPSLYSTEDESQVLASGEYELDMPLDFERLVRLEKQVGEAWVPVEISDELTPHYGTLTVREEDGVLRLAPVSQAAGTWRIIYVAKPDGLVDDDQDIILPEGLEGILVQDAAAFIRRRHDEDGTPHLQMADAIWQKQKSALRRRYGKHAQPGVRRVRGW